MQDSVGELFQNALTLLTLFSAIETLPYSIRVLLESAVRNCDEYSVKGADVENILAWEKNSQTSTDIPFKPARVILQDFT